MHLFVFDIDGTISETTFPRPHTPVNLADAVQIMNPWRVSQDKPRSAVIHWIQDIRLYAGHETRIYLLTGRPEASRVQTEAWLLVNGVPYDHMIMVGEPGCKPTHHKKREWLESVKNHWTSIVLVDDDPAVGKMCDELGIGFVNAQEVT